MEVIYTPPWQEIQSVVQLALQEDVDLIGVSTLATDHLIIPDMMAALREAGLDSVAVFIGGIIPEQERPMLLEAGVRAIFGPGSLRDDIVGCARELASEARVKKYQSFGG
jgi:methylmalonyl-CoA mutase C-terminal domain/subunit